MKHYLVTLWNVDCYDLGWLHRRQKVFEKFTLPSVEGQNNKNFEWIFISDIRTPDTFKNVLDAYPAKTFYYDFENYNWKFQEKDFSEKINFALRIETIGDVVAEAISNQDTDYIITSRLDNDDILSKEHLDRIQESVKSLWKKDRRFWFSFPRGYRLKGDKMYPFNSLCNSFLSFVEPPNDLKTCYQCCHTVAKNSGYPIEMVRKGQPTWAEVIHGENVLNRVKRFRGETDSSKILGRFSL